MNKAKKNIVIVGFNNEEKSLKELIESKENISEQLRLLRKYKNREDVKEYIDNLFKMLSEKMSKECSLLFNYL